MKAVASPKAWALLALLAAPSLSWAAVICPEAESKLLATPPSQFRNLALTTLRQRKDGTKEEAFAQQLQRLTSAPESFAGRSRAFRAIFCAPDLEGAPPPENADLINRGHRGDALLQEDEGAYLDALLGIPSLELFLHERAIELRKQSPTGQSTIVNGQQIAHGYPIHNLHSNYDRMAYFLGRALALAREKQGHKKEILVADLGAGLARPGIYLLAREEPIRYVGVEIDEYRFALASKMVKKLKLGKKITLKKGSILEEKNIPRADLFYLFNPVSPDLHRPLVAMLVPRIPVGTHPLVFLGATENLATLKRRKDLRVLVAGPRRDALFLRVSKP